MTKRYRLVVFDWEGTLCDTLGLIVNCVAVEANRLNFGYLDEQMARQFVELGLVNAIKKAFPDLSLHQYEELLIAIQRSLSARHAEVYLIPGAREILQRLKDEGMMLAIATNKGHQSLQRALQLSDLESFFKITRSAGQTPAKPCTQMLEEIIEESGVSPEETLMVGDSPTDMEMAKNLHVDAVGVDFYYRQDSSLLNAGASCVVNDYEQLARHIGLKMKPVNLPED